MRKILLGMMLMLALQVVFREVTDRRPIKFEKYSNKEEFQSEMTKRFLGKNIDEATEKLIASGVESLHFTDLNKSLHPLVKKHSGIKEGADYGYCFCYFSPLLSLSPLSQYTISLSVDKDRIIVDVPVYRETFLQYFWW